MDNTARTIRLRDGRTLAYALYGDSGGKPVFYFNGTCGSRLEARFSHEIARELKICLVGVDRPGHGLSSLQKKRTFHSWAHDIEELADTLRFDSFGLMGLSGGGSHAVATAALLGDRVFRTAIVSGQGPLEVPGGPEGRCFSTRMAVIIARWFPLMLRPGIFMIGFWLNRDSDKFFLLAANMSKGGDRDLLQKPEVRQVLYESWKEASRNGGKGIMLDLHLQCTPWNVDLAKIRNSVDVWYGDEDPHAPGSIGKYFEKIIPYCSGRYLADQGHLLIFNNMKEILQQFV